MPIVQGKKQQVAELQFVPRPISIGVHAPWKQFEASLIQALASGDRTALNILLNDDCLAPVSSLAGFITPPVDKPYTRNLLLLNDRFAFMALVWRPEAESSIHAHAGSGCWLRVIMGVLDEVVYTVSPCKISLEVSQVNSISSGSSSYVDDDLGVHSMRNPASQISVSLHFYAPPFKSCDVYRRTDNGSIVVSNNSINFDMAFGKRIA